jgi:hypothetical protein
VTFFAERERIGNDEDGGKDEREDQQNQNKNNDEDTTER